jgi:hypothetical protein
VENRDIEQGESMRLTEAELEALKRRGKSLASIQSVKPAKRPRPRPKHTPGAMNKLETLFLQSYLTPRIFSGEFLSAEFESVKLRLAKTTFYTPDFLVATPNEFIFFEVKGFWEDDARVKIKVAADKYPHFKFIAVQKAKAKDPGQWVFEDFNPA